MSSNITLPVGSEQEGQRIDKFLQESLPGMSRSQAQKWIAQGLVRIGEKAAGKNDKLKSGMVVSVELPIPPEELDGEPDWEVVNKPKQMVVHPGAGNEQGTLVNALLFHCKGQLAACNGMERQGIVHRIDKDTSGLLVCAKDDESYRALSEQIAAHTVDRFYEAVVYGNVKEDSGTIDLPIGRSLKDRKKMAVRLDARQPDGSLQGAREAVTHFEVLRRYEGFTHLRCRLETGRTHQIRVHLSYLGHPVAGDELYGPQKAIKRLQGQCLHARALGFTHPVTGERLYFESQLPEYFTSFLKTLRPKEDLSNGERTDF